MASSTPASATMMELFQARARAIEKCWLLIMLRQLPINTPRMMQMPNVTSSTLASLLPLFVLCNFIFSIAEEGSGLVANYDLGLLHGFRVGPAYDRAVALPGDADRFPARGNGRGVQIPIKKGKRETV